MPFCEFINCLSGIKKNKALKQLTLHIFPKDEQYRPFWKLQAQSGFNPKLIIFDSSINLFDCRNYLFYIEITFLSFVI